MTPNANSNDALQRYAVGDLQIGMFVSSLDCPICTTPFPMRGFFIRTMAQIAQLAHYCQTVWVNVTKSLAACIAAPNTLTLQTPDSPAFNPNPAVIRSQGGALSRSIKPRRKKRATVSLYANSLGWLSVTVLLAVTHGHWLPAASAWV